MTEQQQIVTIEPLDADTLPEVRDALGMFGKLWASTPQRVDFKKALDTMRRSISGEWGTVLLAKTESGAPVGFIYGFATEHDYLAGIFGYERMFYVSQEWRGRGIGTRLLKCFETWCESRGCVTVLSGEHDWPGHETHIQKLYEREGYTLGERSWFKQLN